MTQQCEYAKYINACIEGTLDEERTEALFAHMAEHPECQALFDAALGMSDVLSSLSAEVPEGFSEAVMEKVRNDAFSSARGKKPFPARRIVGIAVAAAAVIALAFFGASRLNISGKKDAASESVSASATTGFSENAVLTEGASTTGSSIMTAGAAQAQSSSSAGSSSLFASQKSASADSYAAENGLTAASVNEEAAFDNAAPEAEASPELPEAAPTEAVAASSVESVPEAAEPGATMGGGTVRQADESDLVRERYNAYIEIHGEVPEAFADLDIFCESDDCIYYLIPPVMLETIDYDYIERYELNSTPVLAAVFPNG